MRKRGRGTKDDARMERDWSAPKGAEVYQMKMVGKRRG